MIILLGEHAQHSYHGTVLSLFSSMQRVSTFWQACEGRGRGGGEGAGGGVCLAAEVCPGREVSSFFPETS